MRSRNCFGLAAIIVCISLVWLPTGVALSEDKVATPEELIQKHLNSLGGAEKIKAIRSWGISGKAAVEFIQGASGKLVDGQFLCVSDGSKVGLKMDFTDINYPGEYFAFDGNAVTVGHITPGQRSPLADFIFLHNSVMKEGLLGGVLTTAWPLLHTGEQNPRMKLNTLKIEGQEYYELEFGSPGKRPGNMTVKLYFDMETFIHRRTEYRVVVSGDLTSTGNIVSRGGGNMVTDPIDPTSSGRPADRSVADTIGEALPDSIYLMIETFDNYANVGGMALPQSYSIEYSLEGQGASFLAKWTARTQYFTNNGTVDQSFFVAQK